MDRKRNVKESPRLLLVGCGKMGGAMLRGWARDLQTKIVVVEPAVLSNDLKDLPNVTWVSSSAEIDPAPRFDAVVLAIKPQQMAAVLPAYAQYRDAVFLSIAAGKTLRRLAELLGDPTGAIVRVMPNLPASIGQGMSVAVANARVTPDQRALCHSLLQMAGEVAWVENEALMDSVTALSGCGPAYVFALVEAMAVAGEGLGLSAELAEKLARQTAVGSGALMAGAPESAAALRQAVASPGGSTAAALNHLMTEGGLFDLIRRAMQAAAARSKELAD